jgi:hypothetical protein
MIMLNIGRKTKEKQCFLRKIHKNVCFVRLFQNLTDFGTTSYGIFR